ncbi:hypothetical protein [Aromatoleum sp.]|uniref:hypothetical protein n=1 Tax=Aromatoleum sp. TaxID=2307007 RepID=UPI002FC96A36
MKEVRQHEAAAAPKRRFRIGIFPGRSIAFSPEWREDGLCVLFDRNSGDYWVVSGLARKIVENVSQDQGCDAEDLTRVALYALPHDQRLDAMQATARNVLDELLRLEILASGPDAVSPTRAGYPLD